MPRSLLQMKLLGALEDSCLSALLGLLVASKYITTKQKKKKKKKKKLSRGFLFLYLFIYLFIYLCIYFYFNR